MLPQTKVKLPPRTDINSNLHPLDQEFMVSILGIPGKLSQECSPVRRGLAIRMVTQSVGPFNVTGYHIAADSLRNVMTEFKTEHPDAYALLKSEGMLCCRAVRGSGGTTFSNHSWGFAVDLRCGVLDELGSEECAKGLLDLYGVMHKHRWWWGAGFARRDPMHWEPSKELVRDWMKAGEV